MFLKLLYFVGLYFVWRAVFRMARRRSETKSQPSTPDADYQDLTSQEISDAEFEDLPDEPS
jgi:hypothetical protein